jgi:hypothetical protein
MERTSMVTPTRSTAAGAAAGTPAGTSARSGGRPRGTGTRARGASASAAPITPDSGSVGDARGTARSEPAAPEPSAGEPQLADRISGRLSALPALAGRARDRLTAYRTPPGTGTSTAATRSREPRRPAIAGSTDWARVGIFSAGVVVGALLGAGTALLLAPASGFETRVRLSRTARRATGRVAERVEDLGDVVRRNADLGKKRVVRGVTRGRWAAEDALERRLLAAKARAAGRA